MRRASLLLLFAAAFVVAGCGSQQDTLSPHGPQAKEVASFWWWLLGGCAFGFAVVVALPLWAANLVVWHVPRLYDAALAHPGLHALQHGLFFTCGALVWAALLEPITDPQWFGAGPKALYLTGMWFFSLAFSQVFLWSGSPFYRPYVHAPRTWGISPLADQRLGGGVMLVEGSFEMLAVLVWLLLRWLRETEARQRLLDAGDDPAAAARAARYGRA